MLAAALSFAAEGTRTAAKATVLVIGDSLSAGYGLRGEESWVDLLQERLGSDYQVRNASISGDTTGGGLARIGKTLATHEPDIVIIELGGNDGLRGLPIENIRDNLTAMAEAVIAVEAKPVLAGMLMPPNLGPRYTDAFQQVYEEVAEATGAALVPFLLEGVATSEEGLMQDDGVHPTAAAQGRLLDNVWTVLAPLVAGQQQAAPR
ncbi:MAG: arylesterase [Gammaproteobacteria bacterium]|nr:arylesterase [Gammaproteobacteria bacterium]